MDLVFTACDRAAAGVCPIRTGQPKTAHWGVEDPSEEACDGIARKTVFSKVLRELHNCISIFVNLPLDSLDRWKLQQEPDYIWRTPHGGAEEITN